MEHLGLEILPDWILWIQGEPICPINCPELVISKWYIYVYIDSFQKYVHINFDLLKVGKKHLPEKWWVSLMVTKTMVESVFNITVFSQKNDQIKGSPERSQASWWFQPSWKIVRQNENLPKVGLKIKNLFWNHHPDKGFFVSSFFYLDLPGYQGINC